MWLVRMFNFLRRGGRRTALVNFGNESALQSVRETRGRASPLSRLKLRTEGNR